MSNVKSTEKQIETAHSITKKKKNYDKTVAIKEKSVIVGGNK